MAWMNYRLLQSEGEGGGDNSGEGDADTNAGGDDGGAKTKTLTLDLNTALPSDSDDIPEPFRGKPLKEVFKSHSSLQSRFTKSQQELKEAQKLAKQAERKAGTDLFAAPRRGERMSNEDRQAAAEEMKLTTADVSAIEESLLQRRTQILNEQQKALDDRFGEDGKSSGLDPVKVIEWARESGEYSDADIDRFNRNLQDGVPGALIPIAQRMIDRGEAEKAAGGDKKPDPARGRISGTVAGEGRYGSRAEYLAERSEAEGDPKKMAVVEKKLKNSNIKAWPDRHIIG